MAEYGHSLQLDVDSWDLTLDQAGNISQTIGDYAVAQDVCNRIRLFTDDAYYAPDEGVPHFAIDLGRRASEALVRSRYREQALTVPGVETVTVSDIRNEDRVLHGDISITITGGGEMDVTV